MKYRIAFLKLPYVLLDQKLRMCKQTGARYIKFAESHHNCTKKFLIDEFAKKFNKEYIYLESLEIYASEYGLRLVNGNAYSSFDEAIRWGVGKKSKCFYRTVEPVDPESTYLDWPNIAKFGNQYVGWF